MKDSFFEMLMNFFEKSLSRLSETNSQKDSTTESGLNLTDTNDAEGIESRSLMLRLRRDSSMRVFTGEEQMKLTKASYQFLMRMIVWDIIGSETMELIINQLVFSESRIVTLEETKWTIRNTLAEHLDGGQLAFLDLVLYQKEDKLPLH
jgi:uncharacterized protein Smg (DUF494 family)